MKRKIISIKVNSEETETTIIHHLKRWLVENFKEVDTLEASVCGKEKTLYLKNGKILENKK